MPAQADAEPFVTSLSQSTRLRDDVPSPILRTVGTVDGVLNKRLLGQLALVFLAYLIAGKIGQATTNIRSSNLGPVWPAYGIALAAFLAYGYRVWPGIAAGAFLVAVQGSVPALAAAGQAAGATLAAVT